VVMQRVAANTELSPVMKASSTHSVHCDLAKPRPARRRNRGKPTFSTGRLGRDSRQARSTAAAWRLVARARQPNVPVMEFSRRHYCEDNCSAAKSKNAFTLAGICFFDG
jgi:hypothetical protein